MSARVIHQPTGAHRCTVGWEPRPVADDHPFRQHGYTSYLVSVGDHDPPGTIRQCECGKTWVGYRERYVPGMRGSLCVATQWRPEGRFERWRRERRERRESTR